MSAVWTARNVPKPTALLPDMRYPASPAAVAEPWGAYAVRASTGLCQRGGWFFFLLGALG